MKFILDTRECLLLYCLIFLGCRQGYYCGYLVGGEGLEPSFLAEHAPKACVSANFTTRP